jgi:hypothetical protein
MTGQVKVTVALRQGQGVAVLLYGTPTLRRELFKLRPWRVRNASRVSLRDWSTNQYDAYPDQYRQPTQTEMVIGWSSALPASHQSESFVGYLGSCAFNLLVRRAPTASGDGGDDDSEGVSGWRKTLNAGMRQGLAVLADVSTTNASALPAVMAAIQADYRCHPAFGGYRVPAHAAAVGFVRESAPHLFAITPVEVAAGLAAAVSADGLRAITPALRLPAPPGFHFANGTDRAASCIATLQFMRAEISKLAAQGTPPAFSPWVELDVCGAATTPGVLRLQAFAAVCYGAQAVLFGDFSTTTATAAAATDSALGSDGLTHAPCGPVWPLLRSVASRLAGWGDMLLRQSILAIFAHDGTAGVTQRPGPGKLVVGLGPGVQVTVLTPLGDKDPEYGWMKAETAKAPPALLVLNGNVGGEPNQRTAVMVELDSDSVVGYAPFERDCASGTSDACQVMVVGSTVRLELLPGEAEYVQLVMAI